MQEVNPYDYGGYFHLCALQTMNYLYPVKHIKSEMAECL